MCELMVGWVARLGLGEEIVDSGDVFGGPARLFSTSLFLSSLLVYPLTNHPSTLPAPELRNDRPQSPGDLQRPGRSKLHRTRLDLAREG